MKKYLFTFLLVTGITGAALACGKDKEKKETTSPSSQNRAAAGLPQPLAGTWQQAAISRDFRQAVYLHREIRESLFFSGDNARLLAGIERVHPTALPGQLKRQLRKTHPGYRIAQVLRYDDGQTLYFVSLAKDQERVLLSFSR
ncbi:MAG: hypothetical protein ACO1O1_17290 [Adhaeribacter sp.]